MDNPETLAILCTQDTGRRQIKHNTTQHRQLSNTNPTKTREWTQAFIWLNICAILSDATSCERCYSSFFCEGDGEIHTCGRCENDTESCDRSPTEFSFGAQSECSSCLDGWVGIEVAHIIHFEINLMDCLFLHMECTFNSTTF